MPYARLLGSVLLALLFAFHAAQAAERAGADAAGRCDALQQTDFTGLEDAKTQVNASAILPAQGKIPAFCQVQGYVAPNTGIELRLPVSAWNGKFFYAGCTGSCGFAARSEWTRECDYPLIKGYACIISDMGHQSTDLDGLWALDNLPAQVDFGFRATHRTALAGKALTAAFYGTPPAHSYFMGCSTGGRQALVEAQRFPWDFDGIIAGAAVITEAGTAMDFLWNLTYGADANGQPLFSHADLKFLHDAELAASDKDDGLQDGIINDPRASNFDPLTLVCKAGQTANCLTAAQAEAAKKIYAGPMNSMGETLYHGGGIQPGSELNWTMFVPEPGKRAGSDRSASDTTRFMLSDWGAGWTFRKFDYDRDYKRMGEMDALYSASNPDLRQFHAAGGKLILFHGWADPAVAPLNSVDYYESVEKLLGRAETQSFARLFMVPGMNHCFGGAGAFSIDYISALEAWVERDAAPDRLRAAHLQGDNDVPPMIHVFPADPKLETFTRPVFPYPIQARYNGTGDARDEASFHPVTPPDR
jgi:feruloyl esterase